MESFAKVEDQYQKWKQIKKEDIARIQEWLKQTPHLPNIEELEIILFYHSCNYSSELTKQYIEIFYTTRSQLPDFFQNRDPCDPEFVKTVKNFHIAPLPKLTPEGYGVLYYAMGSTNVNDYNFNMQIKIFDMASHLFLHEQGCLNGLIMIMDLKGSSMGHMSKVSLMQVKKMFFYIQECLPVRLVGVHYINPVPFMDKLMAFVGPWMKKDLYNKIQIHQKIEELYKYVPKDCLPNEIGGTYGPVAGLRELSLQKLQKYRDYIIEDDLRRNVDESKRVGKAKALPDFFGTEGTFKKLDID